MANVTSSCDVLSTLCLENIDGDAAGIILEVLLFGYCFIGLAIVCDDYLVVALETLCIRWGVREDVAGATFMAFGSAAPEIIINVISTIKSGRTSNNPNAAKATSLGISAIIGSGMIAFCLIPGVCGLAVTDELELKRRPLLRDVIFYTLGLALLVAFFHDGKIQLIEGCTLVGMYVVYVIVVAVSPSIRHWYRVKRDPRLKLVKRTSFVEKQKSGAIDPAPLLTSDSLASPPASAAGSADDTTPSASGQKLSAVDAQPGSSDFSQRTTAALASAQASAEEALVEVEEEADEEEDGPKGPLALALSWLAMPLNLMFKYTMPDVSPESKYAWAYGFTFALSFVYVAFFSFVIGTIAGRWSDIMNLPGAAFGLFLISIGAEVPDTIQSVTVAKRGYGSMAVSNCVGSQICNIFIGLGLPWMLYNAAIGSPVQVDTPNGHEHNTLRVAAIFQFCVVSIFSLLMLGTAVINGLDKAQLNKMKSYMLITTYILVLGGFAITIALDPNA